MQTYWLLQQVGYKVTTRLQRVKKVILLEWDKSIEQLLEIDVLYIGTVNFYLVHNCNTLSSNPEEEQRKSSDYQYNFSIYHVYITIYYLRQMQTSNKGTTSNVLTICVFRFKFHGCISMGKENSAYIITASELFETFWYISQDNLIIFC
jgi:hypothetical protein